MKNKETLEEAAEKYANHSLKEERQKDLKLGFKEGAKWQSERSYSEEEVIKILHNYRNHFELYRNIQVLPTMFFEWFEQFKKPNTWYNEEQTNKRMNVIGQNGNDGTHYENK